MAESYVYYLLSSSSILHKLLSTFEEIPFPADTMKAIKLALSQADSLLTKVPYFIPYLSRNLLPISTRKAAFL
jgi:hypothetical protein